MAQNLLDRKGVRKPSPFDLSPSDAPADWHTAFESVRDQISPESLSLSNAPQWRMSARDFGNGHRECSVWRHTPDIEKQLERAIQGFSPDQTARGEGDLEANRVRVTRRAKQKIRHLCKSMAVNSLWTLTYRENVIDRALVLKHLDAFRRRVVAVLGEWKYVAVLEKQKRGAYHIHLATHALPMRLIKGGVKVKSWLVMRAIWLSVVGELGGAFDEAKRKKRWGGAKPIRASGAIASYIGGYVAKDMCESQLNQKRYSVTKGISIPDAVKAVWRSDIALSELIELAFAAVGENITRVYFQKETSVFYIESDDSVGVG